MNKIGKFGVVILAVGSLAGCSDDDFSGAYSTDGPYGKQVILNISSNEAKILLVHPSKMEISDITDFEVSYKNEKLLLDYAKENIRLTFKRSEDERGLNCLNCNDGTLRLPAKWTLLNQEPYDVEAMLRDQEERRQAAIQEARKLDKFNGDWVSKRRYKESPLLIMSISPREGVIHRVFNYSNATKVLETSRAFKFDGDEIVFPPDDSETRYALSADGTKLSCTNCTSENDWVKADPRKIKNFDYTRNLAGNPQNTRE